LGLDQALFAPLVEHFAGSFFGAFSNQQDQARDQMGTLTALWPISATSLAIISQRMIGLKRNLSAGFFSRSVVWTRRYRIAVMAVFGSGFSFSPGRPFLLVNLAQSYGPSGIRSADEAAINVILRCDRSSSSLEIRV
jgi:hypothetical protein